MPLADEDRAALAAGIFSMTGGRPSRFADRPAHGSERRVREKCRQYFRERDAMLAEVLSPAGPDATVVFASDHGFGPQTGTFALFTKEDEAKLAERLRDLGYIE